VLALSGLRVGLGGEAREIREVGFFQAVRAALVKTSAKGRLSEQERMFAVGQLIDQAIASAEIVDILAAAGMNRPNLSVLSEEFLLEVQQMERKNLALEALRKLLNGEIKSRSRSNVVETRRFSERLEAAVARYHANALSTVEVIQELIKLAQDMRAAAQQQAEAERRGDRVLRRSPITSAVEYGRREAADHRNRAAECTKNECHR
jgi:type I restriction enzyme R subunit